MHTRTLVKKWGNSLGIRIPAAMAVRQHIAEGSEVDLVEQKDQIVIRPEPEPTLKDLLAQIKSGSRPALVDWGKPVGKEVW